MICAPPTATKTAATVAEPHTFDEARLQANVNHRAGRLFQDGYRADWLDDNLLAVTTPECQTYEIDTVANSCTCPFFVKHRGRFSCKHILGYPKLLADQEARRRHNASMWEALQ